MDNKNKNGVNINKKDNSSITEFIKRPLPRKEEIDKFDELIEEKARDEEIDESLSEIYQDDDGQMVDVKSLNIKKKQGFFFWFFSFLFTFAILGAAVYGLYYFYWQNNAGSSAVTISIESKDKIIAGEEFFYNIYYNNSSAQGIKNVHLEAIYPENFIFLESDPQASENKAVWKFDYLSPHSSGVIKIKGKIIDKKDASELLQVRFTYSPENITSEFKKETTYVNTVEDVGVDAKLDYSSNALVGNENLISVKIKAREKNYLNNFRLVIDQAENIEFSKPSQDKIATTTGTAIIQTKPNIWQISELKEEEREFTIKYKLTKKITDNQEIIIRLEQDDESGKAHTFFEEKASVDVMNSDLNLNLEVNGLKSDSGVNFGDEIKYSITYANKGSSAMKDVVIMAVLDSELLDWTTLKDKNNGQKKSGSIVWSKVEIPALEELKSNDEGKIEFSIKVKPFNEADLGKKFEVSSYAQFNIGNAEDLKTSSDNRSNNIVNKINSDFSISEELRYFDKDNLPVGTGPLPPRAGETTTFRVYWTLTNNLHELNDTAVEAILPSYVKWSDKSRSSIGSVQYDSANNKVIWQIGRLPISIYRVDAEFDISVTPTEVDRDKILVLLNGSSARASDSVTGSQILQTTKAKTTKLEDDDIASMNNDGRVQ
ncbi:MAG: hypothetical protein PHT51_03130 [Patescibacteria group bacterium]|nr:hypothetical protein [Patescibacteria group bacterium]MDD4611129.1 hypothetical protein [Patescibacteria group bacterium]